VGAKEKFY